MSVPLRELQENFQAYILTHNQNILDAISTEQTNAIERIDIYKKGYTLRLLEILEKDFPLLRQRIGAETFDKVGYEYIKIYPSTHFNICIFSRFFSQFLIETGYELYWSEIADFEWALSTALDAADSPQIGLSELSTIAPESWPFIQFDFHPSVQIYQFRFNAPQITYAMMLKQETIPELIDHGHSMEWIIWRFNLQSYFESVCHEQVWMIKAIREGKTFAEICEGLCQWLPEEEVAVFAAGSLRNWLEKGLFSAVRVVETITA